MGNKSSFWVLLILVLVLGACQLPGGPAAAEPSPSLSPSAKIPDTAVPTLERTKTPSPVDALATARAQDQATREAGPTRLPTATAVTVSTLDPNRDYWWNERVFYEIFVRSFKDSDGDGIGDFNGLTQQLDYLNDGDPKTTTDLGITGIWLMPIMESPSYHGYDVVDYLKVDSEYGTPEDFKRFLDAAHQRGIRVVVDLVLNHTSSQHPWFIESKNPDSPYRDWYIWSDTNPNYPGPWGQPAWHSTAGAYYYGVFWSEMPDLNLSSPEVTAEIQDITRFWLEDMGVDGFRLDAIKHLIEDGKQQENTAATHAWLTDFFRFYKGVKPDAFTVGEAWTDTTNLLDYTAGEMDIVFAFDLAEDMLNTANGARASAFETRLNQMVTGFPAGQYATFLANHDQNRVMSQLRDERTVKLAALLLLTSPGVPFLYYGEEIGMNGVKPDEDIRRPMQWSAENPAAGFTSALPWRSPDPDFNTRNVKMQNADPDSLINHYRALIRLRNAHPALRTGQWTAVETGSNSVLAYLRYIDSEIFLIVANNGSQSVTAQGYSLELAEGPLGEGLRAVSILGLADPAAPQVSQTGGLDAYKPFAEMPAKTFAVIHLIP